MASSVASAEKAYASLGVPAPRRTFLDRQGPSSARLGSATATRSAGGSAGANGFNATPPLGETGLGGVGDASKAMLLASHKVELEDMLNETLAQLRSVYRAKFVFGDHLRIVDPSFSGDTVNQFQLSTPPVFDPAFAGNAQTQASANSRGSPTAGGAGQQQQQQEGDASGLRDKLRTAEELIKKIYRRNQQLELENKYLKAEVSHHERLSGLGRTGSHNLCFVDGHIPNDHPLYSKKLKRRCRSGPPTRTLLRTAVGGYGLSFPTRGAVGVGAAMADDAPREDPLPVQQLKRRVHQLTEALVTVQHENEQLAAEKAQRLSLRDTLLKSYLVERDQQIAALHNSLQEIVAKVHNPMKLARARQPSAGVSPLVATNNVVKELNQRLAAQVSSLTDEIVAKAASAMPAGALDGSAANAAPGSPRRPNTAGTVAHGDEASGSVAPHPPGTKADTAIGSRRRELTKRVRAIVDTLPTAKRKQLLLVFSELKQLYEALASSNRALLASYEDHKTRTSADAVQMRLRVAMLTDQLRALGVRDEELEAMLTAGSNRAGHQAAPSGGALGDP